MNWWLWLGGAYVTLNSVSLLCAAMLSSQLSREEEAGEARRAHLGRQP
ncbi:hypothetical protein [Deinococcus sp. QL22]|nr:hypothetical protein [Deinococcus sp. QL22]UQN10304.1 hypothetical protein M1R55_29575 [Deinococcus sp. QL22]UQN10438.1 hypothetical protein M1R55_28900 [Deinococcus sp. QL22]